MRMKSWAAGILAGMLAVSTLTVPALAEETASTEPNVVDLEAYDVEVKADGTIIGWDVNGVRGQVLLNTKGEAISEVYSSMYYNNGAVKVENSEIGGIHDEGVLDTMGNVLVPVEYAAVEILDANWQIGLKMVPSEADDKDYTFTIYGDGESTKEYYRIDTADVYYKGQLAGTLNRSQYGNGYNKVYGAYIVIENREGKDIFYNSKLEQSPRDAEYSSEYDDEYKDGSYTYIHNGTGKVAFVPEFDVPAEDLEDPYLYDKMVIYDPQGNVIGNVAQNYDYVRRFYGGYAVVTLNNKKGLINLKGEEVIAPLYDDLGYGEPEPLRYGCISAVQDGKFGFVDAQGNVTCDFVYSSDIVSNKTSFATLKNLDGTIIVLSGLGGELPEHYADVRFPSYYGCRVFTAENADGQLALIDAYGQEVIPFGDYRTIYSNCDGNIVSVQVDRKAWKLYEFPTAEEEMTESAEAPAETEAAPAETAASPAETEAVPAETEAAPAETEAAPVETEAAPAETEAAPAEAPAADDGSWTCPNGHAGNTGNFCSECGSPRPEEAPKECPNCHFEFPEGTVPNFCPECGTKIAQ